jgi:DNA polymerase III epsilon subunit-like protein
VLSQPIYVVTDIEADGPIPGENSMLAFASVAIDHDGREHSSFEAVVAPLADCRPDAGTMSWFATEPEAWAAATLDPRPADAVMSEFVAWVRGLPGEPVFAAHPLAFDGGWMAHYLQRFTSARLVELPRKPDRLFRDAGLCIRSLAAGRLGWPLWECKHERYPADWLGDHPHSHRAIDDARGYARLLAYLLTPV